MYSRRPYTLVFLLGPVVSCAACASFAGEAGLSIHPPSIALSGPDDSQTLVVMFQGAGRRFEVTREATLELDSPNIVKLEPGAAEPGAAEPVLARRLTACGDGTATLRATWDGHSATASVRVSGSREDRPVSFELDVLPILTAKGCNSGACHGKARGQNGFQLSLLGFDPDFDHGAITRHARGRRVFPSAPEKSLILHKATAEVPHGGGRRIDSEDDDYQIVLRWIRSGCRRQVDGDPELIGIELFPQRRFLEPGESQQLVVTAKYSDGTERDVTRSCTYQSNESAVVAADETGRITAGDLPGEAAIMARYMGCLSTCLAAIPIPDRPPAGYYDGLPVNNFIDRHAWNKLRDLGFTVSAPADDATFLRRVHLDVIGRIPTPAETREFLSDTDPNKRAELTRRLLERPEYADHWANKWMDLLRPNPYRVGIKAVLNYDNWIRQAFRENRPYDRFVHQLLTARGSTWRNGAVTLFRDRRGPDEVTTLVSQLFLGIRLECAKCHHHPFETYSQRDFYSFAAYFARVGYKGTGLSPPISGGEEMITIRDSGSVRHPLTGETLDPAPLVGTAEVAADHEDPRVALADWITSDDNRFFAKSLVNRVWADLMGRGLVEPVDDLRATNPATNEPLLDALADHFRDSGYDLKELIRAVVSSHVYALSAQPTESNVADRFNYSRHYRQRLRAEVLLDAVSDITGVETSFSAMPPGSRANQIWTHRVDSLFLDTFGRPDPNQDPPCERTTDSTVTQSLHMMNSTEIQRKLTDDEGRAAFLAGDGRSTESIIDEVYLWVYARYPTVDEKRVALEFYDGDDHDGDVGDEPSTEEVRIRRNGTEDLIWALLNTPEFLLKN